MSKKRPKNVKAHVLKWWYLTVIAKTRGCNEGKGLLLHLVVGSYGQRRHVNIAVAYIISGSIKFERSL
jgi:hypothetical protein